MQQTVLWTGGTMAALLWTHLAGILGTHLGDARPAWTTDAPRAATVWPSGWMLQMVSWMESILGGLLLKRAAGIHDTHLWIAETVKLRCWMQLMGSWMDVTMAGPLWTPPAEIPGFVRHTARAL
jgi:hypothetical protein